MKGILKNTDLDHESLGVGLEYVIMSNQDHFYMSKCDIYYMDVSSQ